MRNALLRAVSTSALTLVVVLGAPLNSIAAVPTVADCDQTYYPLKLGQKYVYVMAGRKTVTVFTKVDRTSFTYESTEEAAAGAPATKTIANGTCMADGIRIDSVGMGTEGALKFLNRTGVNFGRPAAMKVGGSWVSGVTMEMTTSGETMTFTLTSRYKVIAVEKIRVPAGEYEALRIEMSNAETTGVPPTTSSKDDKDAKAIAIAASHATTTVWLAKGVGPIKVEMKGSPASPVITSELVTFSR